MLDLLTTIQTQQTISFQQGRRDGYFTAWQQIVQWVKTQPEHVRGPVLELAAQAVQQEEL
jgi:hypothetical protein